MEGYGGSANMRDYLDFDLEIRKDAPIGYSVSVRSPAGEAQEQMSFPFNERQLRDKLKDLEIALLRAGGTSRSLSREELTVQDFGRSLFEALLVGDVRTRYRMSLEKAEQQDKGLRIKLRVKPPELAVLPWEFLYDSDRDYLCFSSDTPIVRYVDLPQSVRRINVAPPLRILGMVASPRGLPQLDVAHEQELMNEAIEELRVDGLVELIWLEGETWRDLRRFMRRGGPWHVFHFVGHGEFDVDKEEGVIALTDGETGRAHLLRSRDLARLLNGYRRLRLVFLNSCEGARGSEGDPFSGTAAALVHNRIPAVVAMQYQITDKAAIEFSRSFYEAVADGLPVDAAVTDARVAMSMDSMLEWGTPVLYMRSPDGRLFDISTEVRPPGFSPEHLFTRSENRREQQTAEQRAQTDRQIEEQRAQESAIQAYREELTRLVREGLHDEEPLSPVRLLARSWTLTLFSRLDPERKRDLLQLLHEAGLIRKGIPVIGLSGADLKNANLRYLTLENGALNGAILENADLRNAKLSNIDLGGAYLSGADLRGASLVNADLQRKDELNLSSADLSGADLKDADLTGADLSGVKGVNKEKLEAQAKSLKGAAMPDGSERP